LKVIESGTIRKIVYGVVRPISVL